MPNIVGFQPYMRKRMIRIVKNHEPKELKDCRESESSTGMRPTCDSMSSNPHEYVLSKLVEEQGGLCACCMCRIPETDKKQVVH